MLSGDVSLLSEACGHVVHNGDNNAYWVLGHWDALGQLQLGSKTEAAHRVQEHSGTQYGASVESEC